MYTFDKVFCGFQELNAETKCVTLIKVDLNFNEAHDQDGRHAHIC